MKSYKHADGKCEVKQRRQNSQSTTFKSFCQVTIGKEANGTRFIVWISDPSVSWETQNIAWVDNRMLENQPEAVKLLVQKAVDKALELNELEKKREIKR